ncbi:MAG: alpha/beta hydrolase [Chloroflexi bacterium]|nr:MAG: alpha/beta hydrolase [Chloroflexota bacterium]
MDEFCVDVGGQRIRCLTAGGGRPLLLCHGFLSSAEEFGGRFQALAAHRLLIVPDLPGNGGSPPMASRHTVEGLAASLERLLAHLDIVEFDLAGLCLGASVASALARRCGDRVERLVLHTPLVSPQLVRRLYREQVRILTMPPLWQGVVALSRSRTVSNLYKRFVIAEGDVDSRTAQANFDNQRRADPSAAREWLRDGVRGGDLAALLQRKGPTLVIVAARDNVVRVDELQWLIADRPNISLFVDREQGHGWNEAAVQRQLNVMLDFFAADTEQLVPISEQEAHRLTA